MNFNYKLIYSLVIIATYFFIRYVAIKWLKLIYKQKSKKGISNDFYINLSFFVVNYCWSFMLLLFLFFMWMN